MDIWDYRKNFAYDEPLGPDDERRVALNDARGDYSRQRLLRELGIDLVDQRLRDIPSGKCVLFGGHRGCGKSTELRAIAAQLAGPERFFVVFIDALQVLDINNLTYADVALALAEVLAERVEQAGIAVPEVFLTPLREWFNEVTRHTALTTSLGGEIKAGAEAAGGLPFVGRLFAKLTAAIRSNATYKTEIRENVRNSFSRLARGFNGLLSFVESEVGKQGKGRSVIFVVDGTDRLRGGEADDFFIRDSHQLRQLRANSIYCAPIGVLNEQGQVGQNFDAIVRLPMVKLAEKGDSAPLPLAWRILREFVHKRLPVDNFDQPETLDRLIAHSGGHPRDLLRLVKLCFQEIDRGPISAQVAATATRHLTNEYRRLVQPEDFALLVRIDRAGPEYAPVSEQSRRLLYDLALLEYNSYWWQSHPAVRALDAYRAEAARPAVPGDGSPGA
ncbi:AAA family ATPase [Accumulibacter sp.]|uniref:AAA family ATPase n=1 Tax=Accumulibacter sp. TaxID=2053492 RepID=UPI0026057BB4|nr:AAA family ATPase [Accumulibacter sp.]